MNFERLTKSYLSDQFAQRAKNVRDEPGESGQTSTPLIAMRGLDWPPKRSGPSQAADIPATRASEVQSREPEDVFSRFGLWFGWTCNRLSSLRRFCDRHDRWLRTSRKIAEIGRNINPKALGTGIHSIRIYVQLSRYLANGLHASSCVL